MAQWTQDEAIAFECARECISDLMAICSSQIADEEARAAPDPQRLSDLELQLVSLSRERTDLRLTDHERNAFIRREYGARVRAHREQAHPVE